LPDGGQCIPFGGGMSAYLSGLKPNLENQPEIPFAALEQAAEWFAVLQSGRVGKDERRRWQDWLAADARHRDAWAQVEAISKGISIAAHAPLAADSALRAAGRLDSRRKMLKTLALTVLTAGMGWQLARRDEWSQVLAGLHADHRTAVGESRKVVLTDGTQVWLNTDTALDEGFDAGRRLLSLYCGEIMVDTHPDNQVPVRPFLVRSREGTMRALGTRFSVRQFDGRTLLSVSQGRVEITPLAPGAAPTVIEAGQEALFTRSEVTAAGALQPSRASWIHGMLIAQDRPLGEFLGELARYRKGYLGCDPDVAGLRVVGGFPLHDTDQALAMLQAALPVQVRWILPWWVAVKARPQHS